MDAKEFLSERERMCDAFISCCDGCPASNLSDCRRIRLTDAEKDELIEAVERWSKHHPKMTNGDKFREVFGLPVTITDDWLNKEYKKS